MERFKFLAVVNIILIKDNKILLTRRHNTGYCDGQYELPSGHMDGNETVTEAAVREAREEIGVEIKKEHLKVVHVMHRYGSKAERIEFYLLAEEWQGEPSIKETDKCDDIQWFDVSNLPENIIAKTLHGIRSYFSGNIFSEFDWDQRK